MAKIPQIKVDPRTIFGRKLKAMRKLGKLPGNVFGNKVKSTAITLDALAFQKTFQTYGETTLLDLHIGDETKSRPVLITALQRHPVTGSILHVDFHQVDLTEKVTATIPLEFVGEAPAVKEQGGILVHAISDIEVEALPSDLPDKFIVDLTQLKAIGDSLTLKQLNLDSTKVTIALDENSTIVTIQAPKEEVVETPVETAPAEAETTVQAKPEEAGATPTEPEKK